MKGTWWSAAKVPTSGISACGRTLEPEYYEEILTQTQRYLLPVFRFHQSE
ncbi:exodeoxyribonuclease V subunit gamma [Klebsiella michiganensis]|nr:exodeoxyribonuclease V subunit gamma [Klebsiella michiganensis]